MAGRAGTAGPWIIEPITARRIMQLALTIFRGQNLQIERLAEVAVFGFGQQVVGGVLHSHKDTGGPG